MMCRTGYRMLFLNMLKVACWAMLLLPFAWTISVKKRPGDVYINAGETAELSCDIDSRDTTSQIVGWFHAESETFINYGRNMLPSLDADKRSRYSVTGSLSEDIYTLRIESASSVDIGTYRCGYYGLAGRFTPLVYATITVRRLPSVVNKPQCRVTSVQSSNPLAAGVGDIVDLICRWNADPRVTSASWGSSDGKLLNTRMETNYVWTRKKLSAADNGQNFTCTLMTSGLSQTAPRTCSVSPLQIAPTATISPGSALANVGDTVEFTCEGHGVPEITSYMWMSSHPEQMIVPEEDQRARVTQPEDTRERLQVSNTNVLRILGIRPGDSGMTVACQVHIASGMSATATATLQVLSPPPTTANSPSSSVKIVEIDTERHSPTEASTGNIGLFTGITDRPTLTNRNRMPTLSYLTQNIPAVPQSTPSHALDGSNANPFNTTFTIALAICGLILFILLLITIITIVMRWTKNNTRKHLKLTNGQLPLRIINDTYGELTTHTTTSRDDKNKTYEEVTTVVTIRMTPTPSTPTPKPISPKRVVKSTSSCPIYATPNKLKRSSSPKHSSVQYMNMPDVPSHYDTPNTRNSLPRPSTPPPPPPPRYEDLPMMPPRRHRPLGPAASCSTFSRSTYSSLTSDEDFCESPDIIDAIRANHMAAFKEEMDDIPRNNSCLTDRPLLANEEQQYIIDGDDVDDEYVSLKLPKSPKKLLNVEGLQYADLLLDENPSPEIKPEEFPTQYAQITSTPL